MFCQQNKSRLIAVWVTLILFGSGTVYGQSNKTPEGRVQNFYGWYLKSINQQKDPAKNKLVMNSHLSKRYGRWFYSKVGQNLDYDVFVNGQDWNETWADHIIIGEFTIKLRTAVVNVTLGAPLDEWRTRLRINLVREGEVWKIDGVKGR